MSKIILTSILILTACSSVFASDSSTTWNTFKINNTIIGLTLGENTIEDLVKKMGGELPSNPEDKHELANLCFKINQKSQHIVFSTGVMHDYSTLHGFQASTKIPDRFKGKCNLYTLVKNEELITGGGLHIGQTKDDVLKLLNSPSKKTTENWTWEYENYRSYDTPKTSTSEAGPTDSRYLMKIISKGAYEDGSISVKFSNEKVVDYAVSYFAESDFKIEHYNINTGERIR